MISFERTEDVGVIKGVITDPSVWPWVSDDYSPTQDKFEPVVNPWVWYILVFDDSVLQGLFMLHPHNVICWEIHTCLLPVGRGKKAIEIANKVREWIWEHTPCLRIITNVPETNPLALRLAKHGGMEVIGCNRGSYMKNGKLLDQTLLGVSRCQ